jgi:hypothetical protein
MANYNVSVTQSIEAQLFNIAAGESTTYIISNPLPATSYFVLETERNGNGFYDSTSPKNTSGSFTLGTGITNLIQSDYIAGVIVQPGGGNLTFVPAVNITNSTLYLRGVGSNEGVAFPPIPSIDPDAAAFFSRVTTAGGTLTSTEQIAVNTLVVQMKADGIWNSMKAVYPMVGASAAACAQNLKSSSFTGTFSSGWTFASTGVTPNGTSAFMNTNYNQTTVGDSLNSAHLSFYSRTNSNGTEVEIGVENPFSNYNLLEIRTAGITYASINSAGFALSSDANSLGFYLGNRQASNDQDLWKNGTKLFNGTTTSNVLPNFNIYIGAQGRTSGAAFFSTKQCAFASIGDGLTDTQVSNLYTAVQLFNQTLNRQVGPQIVSDSDAQAFINRVYTAGGVLTNTEANAVNQLTIDMKAAGIWDSMKAVYPMVGASSAACAQNLKSSSFTGTFSSGWTFASTGVTPNGTSAFMNTGLIPNTNLGLNNVHMSYYSRTNIISTQMEMGAYIGSNLCYLIFNYNNVGFSAINCVDAARTSPANPTTGLLIGSRITSTEEKYYTNNVSQTRIASSVGLNTNSMYIGAGNSGLYSSKQCAFASIGDGLTDTQASNLYTAVQAFQTTLSRQV